MDTPEADDDALPLLTLKSTKSASARRKLPKERSSKAERQEFFLPVNGFVWFYPEEVSVINHASFQRLAKINQLGQAHYVFRGATHKRIEHVLGAVGVVQRMIAAVKFNAEKVKVAQSRLVRTGKLQEHEQDWREPLSDNEERFVRLGALLHDIGHLAAGHTLEDELGLFKDKHDWDDRLDYIFGDTQLGAPNWGNELTSLTLAELIDSEYEQYLPATLEGISPSRVVRLLIRKKPGENDRYIDEQKRLEESPDIRFNVCINMIGNTICADLLDYISRDWYHVGKPIEIDDRIFQYMEIRNSTKPAGLERRHQSDAFVINLGRDSGFSPRIRTDGVSAILGLLERRYELAETVLYHKTKLAAGAMLGRALFELWHDKDISRDLLPLSDEQLLEYALSQSVEMQSPLRRMASTEDRPSASERAKMETEAARGAAAEFILRRLSARSLYRSFRTVRSWRRDWTRKAAITDLFAPEQDKSGAGASNRAYAARVLESTFDFEPGSIVISCSNIKPKIADVQIEVDGEIVRFWDFEEREAKQDRHGLSGGHLRAQIKRFGDLWRLDFFIARDVLDILESGTASDALRLQLLNDAIRQVILNEAGSEDALEREADRITSAYKAVRGRMKLVAKSDSREYNPPSLATIWDTGRRGSSV